ncbi:MAG TPA: DMT family transporter [Candidatus Dormibacteraeota bacterium]|nr:DMT family transporter [Candidatus Dormibacteraeota bacterium]
MWFILALLSGLLFATNRMMVRSILSKGTNPIAFMAIHELVAGILLLPFAFINLQLPHDYRHWLILLAAVILIFFADFYGFLSLNKIEASLFQIIGQFRHIIVLFGGYLLFSESLTISKACAVALIIVGVLITLLEKTRIKTNVGYVYALLSVIAISLASLAIKADTNTVSTAFLASVSLIVSGILAAGMSVIRRENIRPIITGKVRNQLLLAAVIFSVFEFVYFAALGKGEASKVIPVTQSSMIFTLIGGYLFLNERDNMTKKILGSALIILGIVLLYFV